MEYTARPPKTALQATCALVVLLAWPLRPLADPTPPPDARTGPRVALGQTHSCAIDKEGGLWCWGKNGHGQLGDGTTQAAIEPRRIGNKSDWLAIQAGHRFTCGLRSPGTLWCWGRNHVGQLGNGGTRDAAAPRQVGKASDWKSVSAQHLHACALRHDNSLWCWGQNHGGQIGDDTKQDRSLPTRVAKPATWTSVSAGRDYTCGLTTEAEAWCWGDNELGVLGNGTAKDRTCPTRVPGKQSYRTIASGNWTTHALAQDGSLWQWGSASGWQDGRRWLSPIKIGRDAPLTDLAAGFGCGLAEQGALDCWQGHRAFRSAPAGVAFRAVAIAQGVRACGLKADGSLWCWGDDSSLLLGIRRTPAPLTRVGLNRYRALTINDRLQTCGVRVDGSLWCWGAGEHTPVRQDGATDWAQYTCGVLESTQHGCKLDSAGTLRCWLSDDAATVQEATAQGKRVQLGGAGEWAWVKTLARSDRFQTCALKKDKTAWCWDVSAADLLGRRPLAGYPEPARIEGGGWIQIEMGQTYQCGLKEDGSVWCWDLSGQACKGPIGTKPVSLPGKWSRLADSTGPPMALDDAGAVSEWSCQDEIWNRLEALGGDWARLGAGDGFCGVKRDGSLWATACPIRSLDSSPPTGSPAPKTKGADTDWAALAFGLFHACALKKDGALWCWGDNELGAVGIGRPEHQRKPVRMPLGKN